MLEFAEFMFWLSKDGMGTSGLWSEGIFREKGVENSMILFFVGLTVLGRLTDLDEMTGFDKVLGTTVFGTFHCLANNGLSFGHNLYIWVAVLPYRAH